MIRVPPGSRTKIQEKQIQELSKTANSPFTKEDGAKPKWRLNDLLKELLSEKPALTAISESGDCSFKIVWRANSSRFTMVY